MKNKYLLSLTLLCCAGLSHAQFQGYVYKEDSSIKVTRAGVEKTLAWCGGLNTPQFASADLNKDGLADLVVYQRDRNSSVKTFINTGTAGAPAYRYSPRYSKNFPLCSYYLILKDYNGDGIADLFESGGRGFTAYRGYYNAANELCFDKYKSLYYNNDRGSSPGDINASVNPQDIPAIVDVDNDGDLDFLAYYDDGRFINWYQNMQVELGKPKDTIVIRLADHCWGKTEQKSTRAKNLAVYCDNTKLMRITDAPPSTGKTTDGGNTPCLIDFDDDGDYDMLDGHVAFNYLVYLKNGKSESGTIDSMIYQDIAWQSLGDTAKVAQWPAAFFVDIDCDGKRDLMVAPNANGSSENYRCSQYYRNIGTDKIPSFKLQSDTFMVSDAIDVGSNAYPVFYDYNKDGKPDLFVGSGGYYETATGQLLSRIMYLQNTSTTGNPSFELITDDFLGLGVKRYKGISLSIGDVNNDGKDDLVMGHLDGSLHFIKNTAASAAVQPDWSSAPDTLRNLDGEPIMTQEFATPLVYDLNTDGKMDLVIGDRSGYLNYFENQTTTAGVSKFRLTTDQVGFAKTDPEKLTTGYSAPFIGKIDNTGEDFLLMGSGSGRIFRYTDFKGLAVVGFFKRLDSAYSYILSINPLVSLYQSAPSVADIDGDGFYEMAVGNIYGGVLMFRQEKTVSVEEKTIAEQKMLIFPNPAKQEINVAINQTILDKNTSVFIYNTMGQLLQTEKTEQAKSYININISALPPSVYFCTLVSGGKQYNAVFMKQD